MTEDPLNNSTEPLSDFDYALKAHRDSIKQFVHDYTESEPFRKRFETLFNEFYEKHKAKKRRDFWKHPITYTIIGIIGGAIIGFISRG